MSVMRGFSLLLYLDALGVPGVSVIRSKRAFRYSEVFNVLISMGERLGPGIMSAI